MQQKDKLKFEQMFRMRKINKTRSERITNLTHYLAFKYKQNQFRLSIQWVTNKYYLLSRVQEVLKIYNFYSAL